MSNYRIQPIPSEIAASVRATIRSPQYGHPVHAEVALGTGPCRHCLETFAVGREERLLFTYQPFTDPGALPSPGPVFIHREPCSRFEGTALPQSLHSLPLAVDGHGAAGALLVRRLVGTASFENVIGDLLAGEAVEYAHLRHAEAGCFIARIDRREARTE